MFIESMPSKNNSRESISDLQKCCKAVNISLKDIVDKIRSPDLPVRSGENTRLEAEKPVITSISQQVQLFAKAHEICGGAAIIYKTGASTFEIVTAFSTTKVCLLASDQELTLASELISQRNVYCFDSKAIYLTLLRRKGYKILPQSIRDLKTVFALKFFAEKCDGAELEDAFFEFFGAKVGDGFSGEAILREHLKIEADLTREFGSSVPLEIETDFFREILLIEHAGIPFDREYLQNALSNVIEKENALLEQFKGKLPESIKGELSQEKSSIQKILDQDKDRIYPHFKSYSCASGRVATENPNIQGMKREHRKRLYMAPKGRVIFGMDISNSQLRVAAHMTNESNLIKAFKEGQDVHRVTAAGIFRKSESDINEFERQVGKTANFQLLFGCGAETFQNKLAKATSKHITEEKVEKIMAAFFVAYPGLKKWQDGVKKRFRNNQDGIKVTTLSGKKIFAPDYPAALNYAVAGSEAEIMKQIVIEFGQACRNMAIDAQIINLVHDSIVVEASKDNCAKAMDLLKQVSERVLNNTLTTFTTVVEPEIISDSECHT